MKAVGFVLIKACQKPLFLLGYVAEFSKGVREVVATTGGGEEIVDLLEDFAGEFGFIVGEHFFDEGPLIN